MRILFLLKVEAKFVWDFLKFKGSWQHFGKCSKLFFSCWELNEKIDTTLTSWCNVWSYHQQLTESNIHIIALLLFNLYQTQLSRLQFDFMQGFMFQTFLLVWTISFFLLVAQQMVVAKKMFGTQWLYLNQTVILAHTLIWPNCSM